MVLVEVAAAARNVVEIHSSDGSPWWVTALVAVGAALLGAVVGGVASFLANDRLERRRRKARAAIRRKAKVYTPVRLELLALREGLPADKHMSGIAVSPPKLDGFDRGPRVFRWREMKADGRALTAASAQVRLYLDAVDDAIDAFNQGLAEATPVIDARGRALYEEVTGAPTTLVTWVHGEEIAHAVRGRISETHLFGFSTQERAQREGEIAGFAA